jgi:hypothetical protein
MMDRSSTGRHLRGDVRALDAPSHPLLRDVHEHRHAGKVVAEGDDAPGLLPSGSLRDSVRL